MKNANKNKNTQQKLNTLTHQHKADAFGANLVKFICNRPVINR